jgi:ubiquinone/menaquinone biosynthesis C-methylase UbiE
MAHLKDILTDFKRCFVPGEYSLKRYDDDYVTKAEAHALNDASSQELQKVSELLKPFQPKKILDLGCNSGRPLDFLCKKFEARGSGVDVNQSAIARATNDFSKYSFKLYDGQLLPFDDQSFDHISLHHVLGHVKDPVLTLNEIKRVLKPGASLSLITPNTWYKLWQFPFNVWNDFSPDVSVLRYFDTRHMGQLLQQLNFDIVELSTFGASPSACPAFIEESFRLRVFALARKKS